jgi:hypothetical protein
MIYEIENIKNQNLICLDFDDCIIEYSRKEDDKWVRNSNLVIIENLKANIARLLKFCSKCNYKVFITSTWSKVIKDDLTLIPQMVDSFHYELWNIIRLLPIIGKDPFNNREIAMDVLLENNNTIICLDDWDLEPHFEYAGDKFTMINIYNGIGWEKFEKLEIDCSEKKNFSKS